MTGVIEGGEVYVWVVYSVTWISLALYMVSLVIRSRS